MAPYFLLVLAPFLRDSESHVPHTFTRSPSYDSDSSVNSIIWRWPPNSFSRSFKNSPHVASTFPDGNRASHIYILFALTAKDMKLFFFLDVAPCSLVDWHWSVGEIYLPIYTASQPRIRQCYCQTSHVIQTHSQFAADAILFHFVLHLLGLPQDLSADRAAGTEGTAVNCGRTDSGS